MYPYRINLNGLGRYINDGALQSLLHKTFDATRHPENKCWGFVAKDGLEYAPGILFETEDQARTFADVLNDSYGVVMTQPFVVLNSEHEGDHGEASFRQRERQAG